MGNLIDIPEVREFEDGVEAYGFWCLNERIYVDEDQFDQVVVNLDIALCPNCQESDIIPVKVIQRVE